MNISFEEKEYNFDDVSFLWYVKSSINDYRIILTFCGAVQEDGEEVLEASMFADIEIVEIRENNPDILDKVSEKLKKQEIEISRDAETIMVCAPSIRETISCRDEASFNDTMDDLNTMIGALTQTLIEAEITEDISERSAE